MISFAHRAQMDDSIKQMRTSILDAIELVMNNMDSMHVSDIMAYEIIGEALDRIATEHRNCTHGMKTSLTTKARNK